MTYLLVLQVRDVGVVHLDSHHVLLEKDLVGLVFLGVVWIGFLGHIAILHIIVKWLINNYSYV